MNRDVIASGHRSWVADITYVATWEGCLYLAVVVDAWHRSACLRATHRQMVGWSMASNLRTELVLDVLNMAGAVGLPW